MALQVTVLVEGTRQECRNLKDLLEGGDLDLMDVLGSLSEEEQEGIKYELID